MLMYAYAVVGRLIERQGCHCSAADVQRIWSVWRVRACLVSGCVDSDLEIPPEGRRKSIDVE